jgi:hypothetical protein
VQGAPYFPLTLTLSPIGGEGTEMAPLLHRVVFKELFVAAAGFSLPLHRRDACATCSIATWYYGLCSLENPLIVHPAGFFRHFLVLADS